MFGLRFELIMVLAILHVLLFFCCVTLSTAKLSIANFFFNQDVRGL